QSYFGFQQLAVSRTGIDAGAAIVTSPFGDVITLLDSTGQTVIHADGDASPTTEGTVFIRSDRTLAINDAGDVGYSVVLDGTTNGASDDRAVTLWNKSTGAYQLVVREGDPFPSGGGTFEGTCNSSLRLFCGPLSTRTDQWGFAANGGPFLFDPAGGIEETARIGQPAPGGGEFFSVSFGIPNSLGQLALTANFQGNSSFDGAFVYLNGVGSAARLGDSAPSTAGPIRGNLRTPFSTSVTFGDHGEAVFYCDTVETDAGGSNIFGEGLFAFDGTHLRSIARTAEPAPGGGTYINLTTFADWVTNDAGQTLFTAGIDVDGELRTGLFLDTPGQRATRLVAIDDTIDGRTVTAIDGLFPTSRGAGSLNERGDVVVRIDLDGDQAIIAFPADDACLADTNGDGQLGPNDFNAWILAFNSQSAACDQNGDGDCRQNDFNAWILNFNAGC
ncbi:MAG: choice-of-anchor tandem repeat NxxGxxAF-containing protein, partial [Planctomycetota bacterium]